MERKGAAYSIKATRPAHHHGEHTQQTQVSDMRFESPWSGVDSSGRSALGTGDMNDEAQRRQRTGLYGSD